MAIPFHVIIAALGLVVQAATHNGHYAVEEQLYFKLLCPQSIVGMIIGKGGANMSRLIATTGAKIKLSQNGDFFPGTGDRVILCEYILSRLLHRLEGEPI